jgi:hypothetical protein
MIESNHHLNYRKYKLKLTEVSCSWFLDCLYPATSVTSLDLATWNALASSSSMATELVSSSGDGPDDARANSPKRTTKTMVNLRVMFMEYRFAS